MKLTIFNATDKHLSFSQWSGSSSKSLSDTSMLLGESDLVVPPHASGATTVSKKSFTLGIKLLETDEGKAASPAATGGLQAAYKLPLKLGGRWKSIQASSDFPWRIYRSKISKGHYKLTVFPRRDLASFLSEMPDSLPLSSLVLPGTHDTLALYGWPFAQCQSPSTTLDVQLAAGIRVIDVRLAVVDGVLVAYHDIWPQRTPFQQMLSTLQAFLTAPTTSRETVVMSIKQEDYKTTPLLTFSQSVHDEIMNGPGGFAMWFLENRIPLLGEVRGKVVMLSRFGGDGSVWENGLEGLGIHPTAWPDSDEAGFTWTLKGTLVRTQDWYDIPSFLSIPEKMQLSSQNLLLPTGEQAQPILNVSFFSAANIPLALPTTVARGLGWPKWKLGIEGVNSRLGSWLLDSLTGSGGQDPAQNTQNGDEKDAGSGTGNGTSDADNVRIRGWAMLDFYADPDNSVVPLLVEWNFQGRKSGEEGWP
ncbi:hypothetical protein V8D89_003594 [Ganoderma adspersum]